MKLDKKNSKLLSHYLYNAVTSESTEFEVLFPEYDDDKQYYKQFITQDVFRNLLKRLIEINFVQGYIDDTGKIVEHTNGYEELDISVRDSHLRMTLDDNIDIQNFCKINRLTEDIVHKRTYKTRFKFDKDDSELMKYEKLPTYNSNFHSELWKFKANLKNEYTMDINGDYTSDSVLNGKIKKEEDRFFKHSNFKDELKYFRYKKRYSFLVPNDNGENFNFRIDLTVVKDSKIKFAKTLHASGVLDSDPHYEIEIEYIGGLINNFSNNHSNDTDKDMQLKLKNHGSHSREIRKLKKELIRVIGIIIQVIQGSFYIIDTEEELFVKSLYEVKMHQILDSSLLYHETEIRDVMDMITNESKNDAISVSMELFMFYTRFMDLYNDEYNTNHTHYLMDMIKNKKVILSNRSDLEIRLDDLDGDSKFVSALYTKLDDTLNMLKNKFGRMFQVRDKFMGPKPVTIEMDNLDKNAVHSILYDYTVTDKADGDGNLLFIVGENFLFGNSINTQKYKKMLSKNLKHSLHTYNEQYITEFINELIGRTLNNVYRIDSNMNVIYTGCNIGSADRNGGDNKLDGCTLLNGEWITQNRLGKNINQFMVYDCYIYDGTNVSHLLLGEHVKSSVELDYGDNMGPNDSMDVKYELTSENEHVRRLTLYSTRLGHALNIVKNINKFKKYMIENKGTEIYFDIEIKNFLKASEETYSDVKNLDFTDIEIFSLSSMIWDKYVGNSASSGGNGEYEYKLDGLIYTPYSKPVGWTPLEGNTTALLKYPIYQMEIGKRWYANMKWKPVEDNSIDFLVRFAKEENERTGINDDKIVYRNGGKFKEIHLYCGKNVNIQINGKRRNIYKPVQFIPIAPFDDKAYIAYLPLTSNGQLVTEQNKQPIQDDSIVEFIYDMSNIGDDGSDDKFIRWKPLRTRHDKTYDYKKSKQTKQKKIDLMNKLFFRDGLIFKMLLNYSRGMSDILVRILKDGSRIGNINKDLNGRKDVFKVLSRFVNELLSTNGYGNGRGYINYISENERRMSNGSRDEQYIYNRDNEYIKELVELFRNTKCSLYPYRTYELARNNSGKEAFSIFKKRNNNDNGQYNKNIDDYRGYLTEFLLSLQVSENIDVLVNYENYLKVKSQYGNDFKTADNNWRNIHFPVTNDMIFKGVGIISPQNYYYKVDLSKNRSDCPSIRIRNFHNYVKRRLFSDSVRFLRNDNSDLQVRLLELACGKGGELHKWVENEIDFVVGIDLFADNIENSVNGAQARYRSQITKYEQGKLGNISSIPDVHFMVGDISKNIRNFNTFRTESGKQDVYIPLMENLLENKKYNIADEKFNLISIQFAIHYLFDKKESLDGLIDNIEENLALGGLFIGTCFDGQMLWNKLKNMNKGDYVQARNEKGVLIWKIKKDYINHSKDSKNTKDSKDSKDSKNSQKSDKLVEYFPNNEKSLGHSIYVYISSIDSLMQEYLVNMNYLIHELEKRNIRLLKRVDSSKFNKSSLGENVMFFEDYYKQYEKMFSGMLSEREKEWSFLNRTFVFRKYGDLEGDIWMILKRQIMEDRIVHANILNADDNHVRNYILTNYLNDDTMNLNKKQEILTALMVKITQERTILEVTSGANINKNNEDNPVDVVEQMRNPYEAKRTMSVTTTSSDEGLLSQTAASGNELQQARKQLRNCLKLLAELFEIYEKFLMHKKHKKKLVTWSYLQSNLPEEKIDQCINILRTASKDMSLHDLYHIDIVNIRIYTLLLDDYIRRKNDETLQSIDATDKKINSELIDYYKYVRACSIMQQCIVDYVARVTNEGGIEVNPLYVTIFTEEHTVDKLPEMRSLMTDELKEHVNGIFKVFKSMRNVGDGIDYNQTVFAKLIQLYGRDELIKFMKVIVKINKNVHTNKYSKESEIISLPQEYLQLYKYIGQRFFEKYAETETGKMLIGGGKRTNRRSLDFDTMFNDLQSFDLYSQASTNNLGEPEFEFMKNAHKNYMDFKQSGGNMNIKDLLFIKNMERAGHCEKFAKDYGHPVCKQYITDISEFKNYLRSQLRR
jgi:hypothetical protein